MYIPQSRRFSDSTQNSGLGFRSGRELLHRLLGDETTTFGSESGSSFASRLVARVATHFASNAPGAGSTVYRRTPQETDTTIGIVVGVILGVFLVAAIAFLYIYRNSIRVTKRGRRHRKSGGSKSSKSSKSSDGGGAQPAPPAG
jgi:hypothetical protein